MFQLHHIPIDLVAITRQHHLAVDDLDQLRSGWDENDRSETCNIVLIAVNKMSHLGIPYIVPDLRYFYS